jgi:SPP1 family predicted phage head-tail adaptor
MTFRGRRQHFVRIEKPVTVKSPSGAPTVTWQLFKPMWVSIRTIQGYKKQSAQASWPGSDTSIGMDFIEGILPTMRIVYGDKIYSIMSIDNIDERNRDINFVCQSGLKAS